jgi:hypothetical protein
METFWLLSQPLRHLRFNLFISEMFSSFLDQIVNLFALQKLSTVNRKHLFMNILCIDSLLPTKKIKNTQQNSDIR